MTTYHTYNSEDIDSVFENQDLLKIQNILLRKVFRSTMSTYPCRSRGTPQFQLTLKMHGTKSLEIILCRPMFRSNTSLATILERLPLALRQDIARLKWPPQYALCSTLSALANLSPSLGESPIGHPINKSVTRLQQKIGEVRSAHHRYSTYWLDFSRWYQSIDSSWSSPIRNPSGEMKSISNVCGKSNNKHTSDRSLKSHSHQIERRSSGYSAWSGSSEPTSHRGRTMFHPRPHRRERVRHSSTRTTRKA